MSQATDNDTFTTACEYNQTVPSQESQKAFAMVGKDFRSDENDDITEREGKDPIQELCQTTHSELTNLGKALTCPICCSTYQKAVLLPCVHAFCQACIVQALRFDAKCPLCKQPSRPRSLVECPVLDEMAVAYKQVMRALGWTPSMYTSVLEMTQLATSEPVPLLDCHDQLQASKAWQRVMEDSEDNKLLREERRKVVQANERAVVQAAVQRQKTISNKVVSFNTVADDHQMEDERNRKSVEGKESSNDKEISILSHAKDKSYKNGKKRTPQSPPETITFAMDATDTAALTSTSETFISKRNKAKLKSISAVEGICSKAGKNDFNEIEISQCQDDSEDDLYEKKSPNSSQESKGSNALKTFDSVKNPEGTPVDRQDSPRYLNIDEESILETPEEIITNQENAIITTIDRLPPADDGEDDCDNSSNGDDENLEETIDCDTPSPLPKANLEDDLTTQVIEVGTIVRVEPRTWPGINKQGGVARVTKVHMDSHAFDVAYILGGKESRVGAVHVTIDTSVSPTTSQQRARRGYGHENIPLSLLQALAREGFATTLGNSKDQTSQASGVLKREKENRPSSSTPKKSKVSKRQKDQKQHLKRKEHPQTLEIDGSKKACILKALPPLPELSDDMRDKLAFEHYLSIFDASISAGIISVVTTGLSDDAQMSLKQLVKLSKKQKVKVKMQDSFHPKNTTVVIVHADREHQGLANVRTLKAMRASLAGIPIVTPEWITHCLTMTKVVPPQLTTTASSSMLIHSLPTKTSALPKDDYLFGTILSTTRLAQAAGSHTLSSSVDTVGHLLTHATVQLCGNFVRPPKSDILLLLRESGATTMPSTMAAAGIKAIPRHCNVGKDVVFLCDESNEDSLSGITAPQANEIEEAIKAYPGRIKVVNSTWLFDVITCGKDISGIHFPPYSPRCRNLWSLSFSLSDKDE